MGGGPGCATTASTGLSPLLTSLLSHCSHGGNSFTAETFVNDGLSGHRRRRRPLSRSSLTKVSAVKQAPPCETMDHTRPFQLVLFSRWRGPRLLPENRPRRMLLTLLSPILHILPIGGPINEIVNLHSNDGRVSPSAHAIARRSGWRISSSSRPAISNAAFMQATAASTCRAVWPAITCRRNRAAPLGTAGYSTILAIRPRSVSSRLTRRAVASVPILTATIAEGSP